MGDHVLNLVSYLLIFLALAGPIIYLIGLEIFGGGSL